VMLVEHAERFGLSQLPHLRGRGGRGAAKSHCLLLTGTSGAEWGPAARERLKVMEETTDGFRIAEADLELRGPGEFLGTRQSGMPDFAVAELARDQTILREAREEAFMLVEEDPDLASPQNAAVKDQLLHRWSGRLSLARVGCARCRANFSRQSRNAAQSTHHLTPRRRHSFGHRSLDAA